MAGFATFSYPTLKKICVDGGYRGSLASITKKLERGKNVCMAHSLSRLSKDYEQTAASAQILIKMSYIHTYLSVCEHRLLGFSHETCNCIV